MQKGIYICVGLVGGGGRFVYLSADVQTMLFVEFDLENNLRKEQQVSEAKPFCVFRTFLMVTEGYNITRGSWLCRRPVLFPVPWNVNDLACSAISHTV